MKRSITLLAAVGGCLLLQALAHAEDIKRTDRDIVTWQQKGSTQIAVGVSSGGILYMEEGLVGIHQSFPFLVAPTSTSILDLSVTTTSLTAGSTTVYYSTGAAGNARFVSQPRYPSPLVFNIWFDVGRTTYNISSTITVSGFDSTGSSRTENVRFSTNTVRTGFAYVKVSTICFGVDSTTSAYGNINAHLTVGTTDIIGLSNDILSADDVFAVWENQVFQSSMTINADFNTWRPNAIPNYVLATSSSIANRYDIDYRARQSPPRRLKPGSGPGQ